MCNSRDFHIKRYGIIPTSHTNELLKLFFYFSKKIKTDNSTNQKKISETESVKIYKKKLNSNSTMFSTVKIKETPMPAFNKNLS